MFVTFFDTTMVSLAAMMVWRLSPFVVFPMWLTFACLDGAYLSSALTKVPSGAWFTITLAAVLASIFLLWRYGKEQQWAAEAEDRFPTSHFVTTSSEGQVTLSRRYEGTSLSTIRGFGIYFDKAGETTPTVFSQFVMKLTAIPEVTVFFHLRPLDTPSVAPEERHTVSRLAIPDCYRLVVRHGYNDEMITPDLASVIADQIRKYIRDEESSAKQQAAVTEHSNPTANGTADVETEKKPPGSTATQDDLAKLEAAFSHNVLYIIGKEQMKIKAGTNYARKVLLSMFLWIRDNTRNKMANLRVPTDKVIEVGFLKEI
jgi:KUP system potassium uptake protein